MKKLLFILAFSLPALGQSGVYNATTYAYTTQVTQGNTTTGSASIVANPTAFAQGIPFLPYNLNAPITINRNAATAETVTPSAIANCFSNSLTCTLSGNFTFKHIAGESIQSGTFGLQEAVNIAAAAGTGTVLVDATWGGTGTSLITGTVKGTNSVMIQDNRNPTGAVFYQWNGTNYAATGGSGSVGSVFGRTGAVTAQTGDYSCAQVTGCNTSATIPATSAVLKGSGSAGSSVTATGSLNGTGDYQLPITIAGSGGISCSLVGSVWTCVYSGSAGSGAVNSAAAFQVGCYPSAGTTIGGCPSVYMAAPAMSVSQLNALYAAVLPGATVILPNGVIQGPGVVNTNTGVYSLRLGDVYLQSAGYGVACDAKGFFLTFSNGSNQVFVGSDLSAADIGKTFYVARRTGYTFADTQATFEPTITAYNSGTQFATISANAPFSFTGWVSEGTDNTTALQGALNSAGLLFPLTIPAGCSAMTGTLAWNNSQSILGQQMAQSGFVGRPGRDILQQPDTTGLGAANAAGIRVENLTFNLNTQIDATLGFTDYGSNGTPVTVAPLYRPLMTSGPSVNDPLAPGWITAAHNGVASTTASSNVICVPTALTPPTVGQKIMFPYFTKIFTATVSSNTGAGCSAGFNASTLNAVLPAGDTATQAEWFTGTALQSTTTTIPTTITYPLTLTLTLATNPIPGFESNIADHGVVKVCGIDAEYMGINGYSSPFEIILRNGPTTTAGCSGTTPIAPMNPCPARNLIGSSADQPYPVTPTINSGDSTPSGATVFPAWCGGNAAISFPSNNGDTYVQTGLVRSTLTNVQVSPAAGNPQLANSGIAFYMAGNNTGYSVTNSGFSSEFIPFGIAEGPASAGQHGVSVVGPTSAGMNWNNCQIRAWFPIILVNAQQGKIDRCDTYTELSSPYDETVIGPGTGLYLGFTMDEQTGGVVTNTSQMTVEDFNSEPETNGGNFQITPPTAVIDCTTCNFKQTAFEGALAVFGGSNNTVDQGSTLVFPAINYGSNNHFENLSGLDIGYVLNNWGAGGNNNQFYNWGQVSSASSQFGGSGPTTIPGVGFAQTFNGHTMEAGVAGEYTNPWENILGGQIKPGEASGLTTPFIVDTSGTPEATWGSYGACSIGTSNFCLAVHYAGNQLIYIGPHNRIAPHTYTMGANLRMATGSNSVQVAISVFDSGSGTCANPGSNIAAGTFTVGTTWTPVFLPVNFTTRAGCYMQIEWGPGSTSDSLQIGAVDFMPNPNWVLGPTGSAPTEGGSCSVPGAWLGVYSGFSYFCDGGTVKRAAVS